MQKTILSRHGYRQEFHGYEKSEKQRPNNEWKIQTAFEIKLYIEIQSNTDTAILILSHMGTVTYVHRRHSRVLLLSFVEQIWISMEISKKEGRKAKERRLGDKHSLGDPFIVELGDGL
ncbi:hypothetical protein AVEN_118096-1 [Araneus ventricosus]|uniref:Uncharacterized protein n=1 Tax=Araneus ventricosus TaxID=182803 RepID=A0A4Y2J341_ARAVE|nr:hypothetical protein AVEN_118096-1 [Araneus ventricosus]